MRDYYARHQTHRASAAAVRCKSMDDYLQRPGFGVRIGMVPVYGDWIAVVERVSSGGTTGSSTSGVDLELKRKVIALAEEARAVLVSANTNLERK
jgi:hypothetical protein